MTPRQHAIALLEFVRTISDKIVADIPDDKLTHQASPVDNHPLWVMGHTALTDAWLCKELSIPGVTVPESLNKAFGAGTKPSPTGNPPAAEVRKAYHDSRAVLMQWLRTCPEEAFNLDLSQKSGGFTTDPLDAMFKIAWHEGWHFGQAANTRKALGLPAVM